MPYYIRKAPNRDLYWVITKETKKKHSKEPIVLEKAKAQLRILNQQLTGGSQLSYVQRLIFSPYYWNTILPAFNSNTEPTREFDDWTTNIINNIRHELRISEDDANELLVDEMISSNNNPLNPHRIIRTPPQSRHGKRGSGIFQSKVKIAPAPMSSEVKQKTVRILKKLPLFVKMSQLKEIFRFFNVEHLLPTQAHAIILNEIAEDDISQQDLQVGDYLIDFNNQYENFGRLMTFETFLSYVFSKTSQGLPPLNPFTREPIDWHTVRIYKIILAQPDSGVTRKLGRGIAGGALENTQIYMSLFPSLMSANSLNTARNFYKQILRTQQEKNSFNHYINLVTRGHYKKFEEISCLNDLKYIIELIKNYKPLNVSASSFVPKEESLLPKGLLD